MVEGICKFEVFVFFSGGFFLLDFKKPRQIYVKHLQESLGEGPGTPLVDI